MRILKNNIILGVLICFLVGNLKCGPNTSVENNVTLKVDCELNCEDYILKFKEKNDLHFSDGKFINLDKTVNLGLKSPIDQTTVIVLKEVSDDTCFYGFIPDSLTIKLACRNKEPLVKKEN